MLSTLSSGLSLHSIRGALVMCSPPLPLLRGIFASVLSTPQCFWINYVLIQCYWLVDKQWHGEVCRLVSVGITWVEWEFWWWEESNIHHRPNRGVSVSVSVCVCVRGDDVWFSQTCLAYRLCLSAWWAILSSRWLNPHRAVPQSDGLSRLTWVTAQQAAFFLTGLSVAVSSPTD